MHPLALRTEHAEHLRGLVAGAAEPVRDPGVELCDLAGAQDQVMVGEHQPHPAGEDVQPLVALVRLQLGVRLDVGITIFQACTPPGCRVSGMTVRPVHPARLQPDPGVADLGRADQLVERDPVSERERQQQLQARPPLPGLQPRQRALGDAGRARRAPVRVTPRCWRSCLRRGPTWSRAAAIGARRVVHAPMLHARFPETATKVEDPGRRGAPWRT